MDILVYCYSPRRHHDDSNSIKQFPECDIKEYFEILTHNINIPIETLVELHTNHPGAFHSLVLRQIALQMDAKYENNIRNCEFIYIYNNVMGTILKCRSSQFTKNSFKYFSAFRSKEECVEALKTVSKINQYLNKCGK